MAEESKTGNGAVVELPKAPNAPMGVAASALQATATTAQPAGRANQDSLLKVSEIVDRVRLDRHTEAASAKRAPVDGTEGDKGNLTAFTYAADTPIDALAVLKESPPLCTVVVPAESLKEANPAYQRTRLFGTDVYSCDSDVVCMLAHLGYIDVGSEPPDQVKELVVTLRVAPPAVAYGATTRCGLRSRRRSGGGDKLRHSLLVESVTMKLAGDMPDEKLFPTAHVFQQPLRVNRPRQQGSSRFCLPGLTVVFDLSMDPCLKYTLPMVMDTYETVGDEEDEEEAAKKLKPSKSKKPSSKAKKSSSSDEKDKSPDASASPDSDGTTAMQTGDESNSGEGAKESSEGESGEGQEDENADAGTLLK